MAEDIRLVEWELDDIMGELQRISLVSDPAIEEDFVFFNAVEMKFEATDEEKRIVTGAAMIPDIKILRRDDKGEKYYGYFSKDTVRKAAELFFKKGSNTNPTNLEHEFEIDGVHVFESWIVEDPDMDKSKTLGFKDVKEGTWMVSMKIDNDSVWDNFVKTGLVKGFSIEARLKESDVLEEMMRILDSDLSDDEKWNKLIKIV